MSIKFIPILAFCVAQNIFNEKKIAKTKQYCYRKNPFQTIKFLEKVFLEYQIVLRTFKSTFLKYRKTKIDDIQRFETQLLILILTWSKRILHFWWNSFIFICKLLKLT